MKPTIFPKKNQKPVCVFMFDDFLWLILSLCVVQEFCADIISVLGMTITEGRDSLNYKLQGSREELGSWGHEYVR